MEKDKYIEGNIDYSTDFPLWKVALLSIITFGLYYYFWFYMNLRFLSKYTHDDEDSNNKNKFNLGWLVLIIFFEIPLLNFLVILSLFANIMKFNKYSDKKAVLIAIFWSIFYIGFYYCYKFDNDLVFLYFLTIIPVLYMQNELNKYFRKEKQHDMAIRN